MTNKTLDQLSALPLPPLTSDLLPILRPSVGVLESITWGNFVALLPLGGQLYHLTLSTAGVSSIFGITAGQAANSTNTVLMSLASAYTKTTGAWVAGSGNGALDTGVIANTTWYHVHLIQRSDTGVVDVLISTSPTSPTLPANYTSFRRIGSMKTDGSAHWVKFLQDGDYFWWDVPSADVTGGPVGVAAGSVLLNVPLGISVQAIVTATIVNAGSAVGLYLYDPALTGAAAGGGNFTQTSVTTGVPGGSECTVRTSTAQNIKGVASSAASTFSLCTQGWIDARGRFG